MSGETEKEVSGWTVDTMRAHLEQRIADLERRLDERARAQDKAVDAALSSAREAVGKAEAAVERRLEGVNEFRQTVTDITSNNVTQGEHDADILRLTDAISDIRQRLDKSEGSTNGVRLSTGVLVSVVTVAILIIGVIVAVANALSG